MWRATACPAAPAPPPPRLLTVTGAISESEPGGAAGPGPAGTGTSGQEARRQPPPRAPLLGGPIGRGAGRGCGLNKVELCYEHTELGHTANGWTDGQTDKTRASSALKHLCVPPRLKPFPSVPCSVPTSTPSCTKVALAEPFPPHPPRHCRVSSA